MAAYPATIKTFSAKANVTSVVDASHPTDSESEIRAIELELGTNPRISTARAATYADVKARLESLETDYRLLTNHDSHGLLTGLTGDDHAQYLRTDGTRVPTGSASHTGLPVAVQAGDTQSQGSLHTLARSDHRHAVTTASPAASAVTDTVVQGVAVTLARSDHKHAREGFGNVVSALTHGIAAGNGAAVTVARSDHTHGTPPLASTTPAAHTMATVGAIGAGTAAAKSDHAHGMPGYGLVGEIADETSAGLSKSAGVLDKVARADHSHGSVGAASVTGPTGVIVAYGGDAAPTAWLLCDGAAVSRTTYSALFTAIGTRWGVGDGSTTFNVPALNNGNRVLRGATTSGAQGTGPTHTHASTATASSVSHTHTGSSGAGSTHNHNVSGGVSTESDWHNHGWSNNTNAVYASGNHVHNTGGTIGNHSHVGVATGGGSTAGQNADHIHATGYESPGIGTHYHNVSGNTGNQSVLHTHSMNFGSGNESSHTHSVTVNAESSHVHAINMNNVAASGVPTADVVFIIKT